MANKITYDDKVGLSPRTVHINQFWDDDANEIKSKHNLNDDRITDLEKDYTGILNYTPVIGTYLGFGETVNIDSNTIHHYVRIGDTHVGGWGNIYKIVYNISTDTWGDEELIYSATNLDSRNICAGYVGSDIFIFFGRYIYASSTWQDAGYIKSTDGGTTWSSYVTLYTTTGSGYFCGGGFGKICKTSDSNTYLASAYWLGVTDNEFKWGYFKTTDGGTTWNAVYVNIGTYPADYQGEPSFTYIGNSRIVCVVRDIANNGTDLWRSYDDGDNWEKVGRIPFANYIDTGAAVTANQTVASIFYSENKNKIIGQFLDRSANKAFTTIADADYLFYSIYGFTQIEITDRDMSRSRNGYASFVELNDNKILCVYSHEVDEDNALLYQLKVNL